MLSKNNKIFNFPQYGEILLLASPERIKEIGKDCRPVLIISGEERNKYSESVVTLPLTTDEPKSVLPVEVFIDNTLETGLDYPSKILCDSPFTWNKKIRFDKKLGIANKEIMQKVKVAWQIAFDIENW